ncbi:hypothetical protein ACUN0C_03525 [Faunimonas sp. B44]|uniref:hypothetical protein n=1 Tax=Faunimonas sp. B44 TaxID=3461493 RepID=UPI0040449002
MRPLLLQGRFQFLQQFGLEIGRERIRLEARFGTGLRGRNRLRLRGSEESAVLAHDPREFDEGILFEVRRHGPPARSLVLRKRISHANRPLDSARPPE